MLKQTIAFPFNARLFPILTISFMLILLIVQIIREVSVLRRKEAAKGEEVEKLGREHLVIGAWFGGTLLILWLFGFMATVIILPFIYLRVYRERWLLSITVPLGAGIFFYSIFQMALGVSLYPGFIFSKSFD